MNIDSEKLRRSPRDLECLQQARRNLLGGRHSVAERTYRGLLRHYPGIAELWFEWGNAQAGLEDWTAACHSYQRTKELAGKNAALLSLLARQYESLRLPDMAMACHQMAVAAAPGSIDARIQLAVRMEKEHRLEDAREQTAACLALDPRDDQARYFHAFLLHRGGDDLAAETVLRDLLRSGPRYPYVRYAAPHLLGVVLDRLGQYREAMHWLLEAKREVRRIADTALLERGYDDGARLRQTLLAAQPSDAIHRWRQAMTETPPQLLMAFLGGHPRSGTTLLEQILGAHSALQAFDEEEAFNREVAGHIPLASTRGDLLFKQLDRLSASRLSSMRRNYLKSLLQNQVPDPQTRVLLDKNPSATMSLNLWLRIMPGLRVIIALRDPRDVVISCFFLNVMLNSTNVNFLSLERSVKHYRDLMDVWMRLREFGGFDWLESRYEDLVMETEAESRRVTQFLGLEWEPRQADFSRLAGGRMLYAPTYHEVTHGIYRRALGRWRNYEEHLAPFFSGLERYCRAFGYEV